jgi:hypothetical protein
MAELKDRRLPTVTNVQLSAQSPTIHRTKSKLTFADRWGHFLARLGVNREGHRVEPGLYTLGKPDEDTPVFVTANYTLSFDSLRSALPGRDAYILVLDTQGINVWCAAGKGTFGTDELVQRIKTTELQSVVKHRTLILPQLGAPGVAAHEVRKRSGFKVEYGPVLAADLPVYLSAGSATPEMRQVRFPLQDRLVLIPVEIVQLSLPIIIAASIAYAIGGIQTALAVLVAIFAGIVLFPVLLPWLPTRDFSSKGLILGMTAALPFGVAELLRHPDTLGWIRVGGALTLLFVLPPVTAYLALNFTGSTTFTSRTGVRREIFHYIPKMAWMFGFGLVLTILLAII